MRTVDQYITSVKDPELRKIMRKLRSLIREGMPEATESIKWGMPYYSINGQGIVSMAEYAKHVNLYFFMGARLSSPLLEGTGKGMRHIKIQNVSKIGDREILRLLRRASKAT